MTRKEAREYIIKHCDPHRDTGTQWDDAMECAIKALGEPERKMGKWVDDGDPLMITCGNCGYGVKRYNNTPFCPHCGARMEGE